MDGVRRRGAKSRRRREMFIGKIVRGCDKLEGQMSPLKRKLSALMLCAAALGFCSSAGAATIVVNGGFETGDFTGWTQTGNTSFDGVQSPGPGSTVRAGNSSAFFGPVGSLGGISQTLTTIAGATYNVTFSFLPDGGNPSNFSASFDGVTLVSLTNPAAGPYIDYSFGAIATGTSTVLAFNFRDDPGFLFLDEVAVNQTPIPAALPLFAGGLGVLGLLARRRKQKAAA